MKRHELQVLAGYGLKPPVFYPMREMARRIAELEAAVVFTTAWVENQGKQHSDREEELRQSILAGLKRLQPKPQ